MAIRLLHTSDWHIGRHLHTKRRYEEHEAFFSWLIDTIEKYRVDVLLIAGDVFDTSTPGNRSQQMYYDFLHRMSLSSCRHVVVVAGNHDSPAFLTAPKELLKVFDVHVTGSAEVPEDQVLVLYRGDMPEMIVCAIPYLRDREIRTVEAGETTADKERKLEEGIGRHYRTVVDIAEQKKKELGADIPIVATGHLFTAGGETTEGDGVRNLYIGTLLRVGAATFPESIRYLALGHLHSAQKVNNSEIMRYSGSPLPMTFDEAGRQKSLTLVEFDGPQTAVSLIDVPVFKKLERITGSLDEITRRLRELVDERSDALVEANLEGEEVHIDLRERLEAVVAGTGVEIVLVRNSRNVERKLFAGHKGEMLFDLKESEVFERLLDTAEHTEKQRKELVETFEEALHAIHEQMRDRQ